jgi:SAM-dependent methyltransferase
LPLLTRKTETRWPKRVPELTEEQRRIQDDWMRYYHERLSDDHTRIVRFNHQYAARSTGPGRTLDIGAGLGEHLDYEDLSSQEYHAVELREDMARSIRRDHPSVVTVVADCQRRLPYDDATFDRAVAIHVLEHLPDLPAALSELRRLLKPSGVLSVVIPCEGGFGYNLGRSLTTKREFERRYKTSYKWHIESDHVNTAREVIEELHRQFDVTDATYFPTRVPLVDLNVLVGLTCMNRANTSPRTEPQ